MILNLSDFMREGALAICPEKVALIDHERQYSFREWDHYARTVSSAIVHANIPLNSVVAVFLPKCAEELIVDLGILYAGCAFSNIDCDQPISRLQGLIDNLKPVIAFAGSKQLQIAQELGMSKSCVFCIDDLFPGEPASPDMLAERREYVIDTDPACIINTSGSTGVPKSCVLLHRGLIDFVQWFDETFKFDKNEVVGSLSPFHFDGYLPGLFMALNRGATLNIIPSSLAMFPVKLAQYLADNHITFIFWVPTVMVNMASLDVLRDVRLPDLKTVCFAGEVFPTKHMNYWRRHLSHAKLVNLYGPIEISVICTYYVVDRLFPDDEPLPIGSPCRNTSILLLNEDDSPCLVGEIGELCVRGSSLAAGYWNDPEKTSSAFCQNPLNRHYPEIIYRTGDLVYSKEGGELMFVGRKDFQVKHQGNRIDLSEIEHFAVQVKGILNACVLYQSERKEITLVYEAEVDIPPATIRTELGLNLPKYMWPTVFHRLKEMPRNANGKIDRQILAHNLLNNKPRQ